MKKVISLVLLLVLVISLAACDSGFSLADFSGKWVREKWIDDHIGAQVSVILYLNADGTFRKEVSNSVTGQETYTGTWDIEDDTIALTTLKMVEGPAHQNYDSDGNIVDGVQEQTRLAIIDGYNLECGGLKFSKED